MEKAYIILAHKNEDQLRRLIRRLDDGMSSFFVHIDKKSPMAQNKELLNNLPNTHPVPGIKTAWGNFGLVEATLKAMAAIKKSGKIFGRIILLSGQDYPIKSNDQINEFFSASKHSIFMDHIELPDYTKWSADGGSYRFDKYFFGFSVIGKYSAKTMNFLSGHIKTLQRRLGRDMQHFYGSQWWVIDWYALNYLLRFVGENPGYYAFHQHTFAPDELFFQTILLNSNDEKVYSGLLNDNLRFMKWEGPESPHPEVLTTDDFHAIRKSSALFARKFDTGEDAGILEMIDEICIQYS